MIKIGNLVNIRKPNHLKWSIPSPDSSDKVFSNKEIVALICEFLPEKDVFHLTFVILCDIKVQYLKYVNTGQQEDLLTSFSATQAINQAFEISVENYSSLACNQRLSFFNSILHSKKNKNHETNRQESSLKNTFMINKQNNISLDQARELLKGSSKPS